MFLMEQKLVVLGLGALFLTWAVYRRARRLIGRQPVHPKRLRTRIGWLSIVGCIATAEIVHDVPMLAAMGAGAIGGLLLSQVGLRLTRFELTPEGPFYTPNAYLGLALIALFLGRELYEFLNAYPDTLAALNANRPRTIRFAQSPVSVAILGAVFGYFICYYLGVLHKTRLPAPTKPAAPANRQQTP